MPESVLPLTLAVTFSAEEFETLAQRVADVLEEGRDDGFLGTDGAAEYLSTTRKAIYGLVERGNLPHHRPAGRLLFDRKGLRAWAEAGS